MAPDTDATNCVLWQEDFPKSGTFIMTALFRLVNIT